MKTEYIKIGRVYRWTTNSRQLVRVVSRSGDYFTVKGPHRGDVPYNFAFAKDLVKPTREELQRFIEHTPIKGRWR